MRYCYGHLAREPVNDYTRNTNGDKPHATLTLVKLAPCPSSQRGRSWYSYSRPPCVTQRTPHAHRVHLNRLPLFDALHAVAEYPPVSSSTLTAAASVRRARAAASPHAEYADYPIVQENDWREHRDADGNER